ncbi:MAG: VWA domain-containing protein [Polyangiaceae bacterium]|nr:VWA domain-containing protein [Polyangiaceae bacterium]
MRTSIVLGLVGLTVASVACGSADPESTFGSRSSQATASSSGGSSGFGESSSSSSSSSSGTSGAVCATVAATSELTPVNLVVMLDRSGSMGDTVEDPSYNPALRWIPVGEGLKAFFVDTASTKMRASLTFFPPSSDAYSCVAGDYAKADVDAVDLPSAALGQRIDQVSPRGDTPTELAIGGAIAQAQALRAAHPTEKTVIVFATDGEPWGCGVNSGPSRVAAVNAAAAKAAAVAADIKTYVIGVGPSVGLLNQLAVAGGTTQAILVTAGQPTQTRNELLSALQTIRSSNVSCDVAVPAAPDGRTLDVNKVDVSLSGTTLPYSADCSTAGGWHFDDVAAPGKVQLCEQACNSVRASGGSLKVSFTCSDVRALR